jgi:hypothetical protein
MPQTILNFQDALKLSMGSKRHLVTGNGFSIAWKSDVFRYDSLFEQADFDALDPNVKKAFGILKTSDFEVVMKHLISASQILKLYDPKNIKLIQQLQNDAESLKNVLVNAIAASHPNHPSEIIEKEYQFCKEFLKNFANCYTLNYDLLLYWVFMHFNESGELESDDGFRTPDAGKADYVSWDIEKTDGQNLFYLHGALHIFDAKSELQKYTWINTGVRLIEQIRSALDSNLFPVFVSEGSSKEKTEKIMHSNYLSRGLRSFSHITGSLFVYGHSLAANDDHILNLIPKSKIEKLFISLHGDVASAKNKGIIKKAEAIISKRKTKRPLELFFYNSETTKVWR